LSVFGSKQNRAPFQRLLDLGLCKKRLKFQKKFILTFFPLALKNFWQFVILKDIWMSRRALSHMKNTLFELTFVICSNCRPNIYLVSKLRKGVECFVKKISWFGCVLIWLFICGLWDHQKCPDTKVFLNRNNKKNPKVFWFVQKVLVYCVLCSNILYLFVVMQAKFCPISQDQICS